MTVTVVSLVVLSAFIHALKGFYTKRAEDKVSFIWCYNIAGLIIYLPAAVYTFSLYPPEWNQLVFWFVLAAIFHSAEMIFTSKSYINGDLSTVYPIMRSSPALVALCAFFFMGEKLTLFEALGIGLVVFGAYIVNMTGLGSKELLKPVRSIFTDKGITYAFLTLLAVCCCTIVDKLAVEDISPWVFIYIIDLSAICLFSAYIFPERRMVDIKSEFRRSKTPILITALISMGGYALILYCFTVAPMSHVVAIRQLSVLFAVLLGARYLQEKNIPIKIISSFLIIGGSCLIVLA